MSGYVFGSDTSELAYRDWLLSITGTRPSWGFSNTYRSLLNQLHRKIFYWSVLNDDNRIEDGYRFREEFRSLHGGDPIHGDCTLLEVILSLSDKLTFEMDEYESDSRDWFWTLLMNAELLDFDDYVYDNNIDTTYNVDVALDNILKRRYSYDGVGGFFPLKNPSEDQRGVELWYQLSAYVIEQSRP